jgi:hypothetical protein
MVFFCDCLRPQRDPKGLEGKPSSIPTYKQVEKSQCKLLKLCWDEDWDAMVARCKTHPREAFCHTRNMDRTALHLATIPSCKCPEEALLVLLETNPHAVTVQDDYQYGGTPLHFLCGSPHKNNHVLVQRFVTAALAFEKQYPYDVSACIDIGWSPLRAAANGAARQETLQILMQARHQAAWIGPWTGAEAYPGPNPGIVQDETPLWLLWNKLQYKLADLTPVVVPRLRHIATAMLEKNMDQITADAAAVNLFGISQHSDQEEAWTQLLIFLRETVSSTLMHTVASLYFAIPGLVQLVVKVFPEQLHFKDESGRFPLHSLFMCPCGPLHFQAALILVEADPHTLTVPEPSTGLQPVLLAASRDAPLKTIFTMLTAYPNALKSQRDAKETSKESD